MPYNMIREKRLDTESPIELPDHGPYDEYFAKTS